MSYRELVNFCEMMRCLGYHRPISMENFRTPNFELVADLTDWLLRRYNSGSSADTDANGNKINDNSHGIPDDISTEDCRVHFITTCVKMFNEKTGIRLNARKLYGADGYAVKELLRVAQMLYGAQKSVSNCQMGSDFDTTSFGLSSKLHDLKGTRSLCSKIVESGATLHDLLQKEVHNKQDRDKALRFLDGMSRNLHSNSEQEIVDRSVATLMSSHADKLANLKQVTEDLAKDEKSLEGKIRKKKHELDRCQNRLAQLNSVRPAFMDEYEKLEDELAKIYESYVARFRNLDYLEHELDVLNREEEERMEENARELKRLQKRLREEEWRMLRGEDEGGPGSQFGGQGPNSIQRPTGKSQVLGSMIAVSDGSDDKSDDGSSEAISVGKSESSENPISISGSDDILEQSDGSSEDVAMIASGRGNDHDF